MLTLIPTPLMLLCLFVLSAGNGGGASKHLFTALFVALPFLALAALSCAVVDFVRLDILHNLRSLWQQGVLHIAGLVIGAFLLYLTASFLVNGMGRLF